MSRFELIGLRMCVGAMGGGSIGSLAGPIGCYIGAVLGALFMFWTELKPGFRLHNRR